MLSQGLQLIIISPTHLNPHSAVNTVSALAATTNKAVIDSTMGVPVEVCIT